MHDAEVDEIKFSEFVIKIYCNLLFQKAHKSFANANIIIFKSTVITENYMYIFSHSISVNSCFFYGNSYNIFHKVSVYKLKYVFSLFSAEFQTFIKMIFASASVLTAERMIKARNDVLMQYPSTAAPMQAKRPFVRTYMFLILEARPAYISVHSRSSASMPLPSVSY